MKLSKSTLLMAALLLSPAAAGEFAKIRFHGAPPPASARPDAVITADRSRPAETPDPITPITHIGVNIAPKNGRLPTDYALAEIPTQQSAPAEHATSGPWTSYHWAAPGTCHQPLYFENPSLERHGYSLGLAQPFASAAHFVGNTAILPYRLVAEPPRDCVYTLGHERPGTPTPLHYYRPRFSVAGGLAEAGVATGLVFLLP